jgi:hypothetical protein
MLIIIRFILWISFIIIIMFIFILEYGYIYVKVIYKGYLIRQEEIVMLNMEDLSLLCYQGYY